MGKNKLKKFAEMETFSNVFQCAIGQLNAEGKFESREDTSVQAMRGHWHDTYFHNTHPIVLELGCGRGEYTVGLSALYPDKNFIGVDIKGARLWAGAKQAIEQNLTNVAFLRTNIEMLSRFFAPDEIAEIWITFPDPQMKKATKRLTSSFFMQRYQEVIIPDGLIHLKTDSPFLSTYTREMIRINRYPLIADTADLYAPANANQPLLHEAQALQTHYEQQWLDRGLKINYITWKLTKKSDFIEPTIEIEKDTYRSYGRNYQVLNAKL